MGLEANKRMGTAACLVSNKLVMKATLFNPKYSNFRFLTDHSSAVKGYLTSAYTNGIKDELRAEIAEVARLLASIPGVH